MNKTKSHPQYEPILPGSGDWPVVQLSKNRKAFMEEVSQEGFQRVKKMRSRKQHLIEELELTLYREKLRVLQNPWKVDPPDELIFWDEVKKQLLEISTGKNGRDQELAEEVLKKIIDRYVEEITGNFKRTSYRMARTMVTFWFSRLLNAARIKKFGSFWRNELTLQDKIHITGSIDQIRQLAKIGTIVMVPTHFSNLDSITIGYAIHTLGLPPFIYGAGLNLFNIDIFAYFMNSLGAYKVDRRKKNLVYLESLKSYSTLALLKGCHSLFFPGGTRSRSGKLENRLKLGLLGTAIDAQRIMLEKGGDYRKIFVFPVVLNYNFVLEAPALINEYLKQKGQERYYVESDEYATSYKIIKFLFKFFTQGSDISITIGKGMDLFGNALDENGQSVDKFDRRIDLRDYFTTNGVLTQNPQREAEYTRRLSEIIVKSYHRINRVFSSHLTAFVAFRILMKVHQKMDLYNLLRLPEDEQVIPYQYFKKNFETCRQRIFQLKEQGRIDMAPHLMGEDLDQIIDLGISNVGMYHSKRPLIKTRNGDISTQDLKTLYYYHNRLSGYELENLF